LRCRHSLGAVVRDIASEPQFFDPPRKDEARRHIVVGNQDRHAVFRELKVGLVFVSTVSCAGDPLGS
jgi:hypothetical protein